MELQEELKGLRQLAGSVLQGVKRKADAQEVRKQCASGLLRLLAVKDANKRACTHVEQLKDDTAGGKKALEGADMTLQNLLYEKQYYEKEIATCRSFQSKVKDEVVALMPVDDFWASVNASEDCADLRGKAGNSDHELMKVRSGALAQLVCATASQGASIGLCTPDHCIWEALAPHVHTPACMA